MRVYALSQAGGWLKFDSPKNFVERNRERERERKEEKKKKKTNTKKKQEQSREIGGEKK